MPHKKHIIQDKEILANIEDALRKTYYKNDSNDFLTTKHGRQDIEANVFDRYNRALKYTVPWVSKAIDLLGKTVVEVGCGTGSSTAAFAHFVKEIIGYDIDNKSIDAAKARINIMGLNNVAFHHVHPTNVIKKIQSNHQGGADIILLYAILEHQTIQERHETLKSCWDLLKDNGILVIADTPNLLCYHDYHTSLLPFAHMLPSHLYAKYVPFSPRKGFNDNFMDYNELSLEELETKICRWGRGVSYHDFELSIGNDYQNYIICNGFEKEVLSYLDVSQEEELLRLYIHQRNELNIPDAFTRVFLNLILKKSLDNNISLPDPPENKKFTLKQPLIECETKKMQLEQTLSEMKNSNRWKMGCLIASPYRKLRQLFRQ